MFHEAEKKGRRISRSIVKGEKAARGRRGLAPRGGYLAFRGARERERNARGMASFHRENQVLLPFF